MIEKTKVKDYFSLLIHQLAHVCSPFNLFYLQGQQGTITILQQKRKQESYRITHNLPQHPFNNQRKKDNHISIVDNEI